MVDLNLLISPGSSLELTFAFAINDRGEIVGTVPTGCTPDNVEFCGHAYVPLPCDEDHPGIEGCDYGLVDARDTASVRPAVGDASGRVPNTTMWRGSARFQFLRPIIGQGN